MALKNNIIVDDLLLTQDGEKMLEQLAKYKPTNHQDDIAMYNHIVFSTLWRHYNNKPDECLKVEVKRYGANSD